MKLFRTRIFKKDYQKLNLPDTQYTKYIKFLSMLLIGKELPLEARAHNLIGNYSGFKEFHVGGGFFGLGLFVKQIGGKLIFFLFISKGGILRC
jgi:mRNA interferase YafQ